MTLKREPILLAALVLLVQISTRAAEPPAPTLPDVGARVRVQADKLGPGWHIAMWNRLRVVPPCYRVLVFEVAPDKKRIAHTLAVHDISRLQVSTVKHGDYPSTDTYDPKNTAYPGEQWKEVSLDDWRKADESCRYRQSDPPK